MDPDSPNCHMICSACGQPSMYVAWDWFECDEDKLWCPKCGEAVPVTEWIEGEPKQPECFMCQGKGVLADPWLQ